jgi:hypothetical protein
MIINVRPPMTMRLACKVLLQVAENPLKFSPCLRLAGDGTGVSDIARLARQASASIVLNCASELWSTAVTCLLTMEPAFPFSEDVAEFVRESRMPWISYLSCIYSMCNRPFKGTSAYQKAKVIIELRDEIIHNKPEPHDHLSEKALASWRRKLEPLVEKNAFDWLPCVGYVAQQEESSPQFFADGSEPTIMKFMKYPIARWVFDATAELCSEMEIMVRTHPGPRRTVAVASGTMCPDPLWQSGKLIAPQH